MKEREQWTQAVTSEVPVKSWGKNHPENGQTMAQGPREVGESRNKSLAG